MPFNGVGIFRRLYSFVEDSLNDIPAMATRFDAELDGFADGLSDCMTRDGESPPTNDIPMGGFRLKGVADPQDVQDAATKNYVDAVAATGDANTITVVAGEATLREAADTALADRVSTNEDEITALQSVNSGTPLPYVTWSALLAAFSAYNAATAYTAGSTLIDQGVAWVNILASTGVAPPTLPTTANANWQVFRNPLIGQSFTVPTTDSGTHTDPTDGTSQPNTGVFVWAIGTSGTGAKYLFPTDASLAKPFAEDAEASAEDAADSAAVAVESMNSLYVDSTGIIGRPTTPSTGTAATSSAFLFADPVSNAGALTSIVFDALATGTFTLNRYTKSGTTYTLADTYTAAVSSTGLTTLNPASFGQTSIPLDANDYLQVSGSSMFPVTGNAADGLGWATTTLGAATISAPSFGTTQRLEIQINYSYPVQVVTATSFTALQALTNGLQSNVSSNTTAVALLSQTSTQIIGRPTTPIDGTAASANTFVMADPVAKSGNLAALGFFCHATGTIQIARYTLSGGVFTRQAVSNVVTIGSTGAKMLTASDFGAFPVNAGDYLAVAGSAPGVFTYTSGTADGAGWYLGGAALPSSFSAPAVSTNLLLQLQFVISYSQQIVTASALAPVISGGGSLSLANVDKIVTNSNSFYEAAYALLGKSPTAIVSALSEYNFGNFSLGSQTVDNLSALDANGSTLFGNSFAALGAKYAIISEYANSRKSGGGNQTDAQYRASYQAWIDTVKGFGVTPIIASEFGGNTIAPIVDGEYSGLRLLRRLADDNGLTFIDVASKSRTSNPSPLYVPFWRSGHPATRVCYMLIDGLRTGLKQLPRPQRSMKIFRTRGTVTVSSISTLLFRSVSDRHRLFRELYLGQMALSETEKVYYDANNGRSIYQSNETQADEYMALAKGAATSLGTYALVDCVLPVNGAKGVTVTLSDTSCTVYARQMTNTAMNWVQLSLLNGVYMVPDGSRCVDRDRLALLVYKSGGISLNASPVINWTSGNTREVRHPVLPSPPKGAELLGQPLTVVSGAVPAQWTNTGSLPVVVPADGILPTSAAQARTGCVEVTNAAPISQQFTIPASEEATELSIRVWARRWVTIFNAAQDPGADFSTAPITYETCDTATLQATLSGTSGAGNASAICADQVGLHWYQYEFRETLEAGVTSAMITVGSADYPIEIAEVSVRVAT